MKVSGVFIYFLKYSLSIHSLLIKNLKITKSVTPQPSIIRIKGTGLFKNFKEQNNFHIYLS